jgi:hypothetical protein
MFWMLHDCGVPVKHLVEPFAGHGDYVTTWRGQSSSGVGSTVGLLAGRGIQLLQAGANMLQRS